MTVPPPRPPPPCLEVVDGSRIKVKWDEVKCKPAASNYAVALLRTADDEASPPTTLYLDRAGNAHVDKSEANTFSAFDREVVCLKMEEGMTYKAQIAVKNGEKWSIYSHLSEPCAIRKPAAPSPPVMQVISQDSIRISWLLGELDCQPPATNVAIALKDDGPGIRYIDKHGTVHSDTVPVLSKRLKEVIVSGLKMEVPYKVQLAVQNAVGWSKYSAFCPADRISRPIQLDPPILEVVHGDRIQVSWDPPKLGLPCTAYAVALNDGKVTLYLDSKGAPHDNKDHASTIPASQTSIMVPLLLENIPYKAQVASRNALGWGPYSVFSNIETVVRVRKKESPVVEEDQFEVTM